MMHAVDVGLAVLVLAVAVWTIVARDTFAAVVGFVTYGLLLTLVWVRLDAVDVALTETAIGSGLTGVLLLGAAARLRVTETRAAAERPGALVRLGAAALSTWLGGTDPRRRAQLGKGGLLVLHLDEASAVTAVERLPAAAS